MKARPIQMREWNYMWRDENSHLYRHRGNRFFLTSNGRNWTQDRYATSEQGMKENGYAPISNEDAAIKLKEMIEKAEKGPYGYMPPMGMAEIKGIPVNIIGGLVNVQYAPKEYAIPVPEPAAPQGAQGIQGNYGQGYDVDAEYKPKLQSYKVDTDSAGNSKITTEYVAYKKAKTVRPRSIFDSSMNGKTSIAVKEFLEKYETKKVEPEVDEIVPMAPMVDYEDDFQ